MSATFETSLFACCSETDVCLFTWCCPFCAHGKNRAMLNTNDPNAPMDTTACLTFCCGYCCCGALALIFPCQLRADVRRRFNMPQDAVNDCCSICCCAACAIGQHTIEIRNRLQAEQQQGQVKTDFAPVVQVAQVV